MDEGKKRKKGRPDRKKKFEDRQVHDETVVKCSINKYLTIKQEDKHKFIDAVNRRVYACSKRTHYASVALNLLVRELIDTNKQLMDVVFPTFCDATFMRQMLLGTTRANKPFKEITSIYERNPHLLDGLQRFQDDYNIYTSTSIKMVTNLKNHFKTNIEGVMKKYLYNGASLNKLEAINVLIDIWGWTKTPNSGVKVSNEKVQMVITTIRTILELPEGNSINKQWLKSEDTVYKILRFFIFVNRTLEAQNKKLISILPINKIKMHHITIDSGSLSGILKDIGCLDPNQENNLGHLVWEGVFDFSKFIGKDQTFTATIDTDGLVVSAHFWRYNHAKKEYVEKLKEAKENDCLKQFMKNASKVKSKPKPDLTNKRVLGGDPGRTNILTFVEELNDGTIKKNTLTRRQYYNDSGIYNARKNTINWNSKVSKQLLFLSRNSPKSVRLDKFMSYIRLKEDIDTLLWEQYTKVKWREQKFRLYGGKKRCLAKFFNRIGDPTDVVIAYGSAKFAPGGKGEVSVPVSRVYKECERRFDTYPVDEFRTSKIDAMDNSVLKLVVRKDTNKAVRGLLWCSSTNRKSKFIDRDVNAALNIRRCFMSERRPLILKRRKNMKKIEQTIGKYIRC